jgi:ubiquinone/menaquinone biosynthesis C-methylase UbiE
VAHRICPWWLGCLLASPIRRLWHNPQEILKPYVKHGMRVLEPGSGMGFFTLDLARLVGPEGKVIAIDVQPRMIAGLQRRARRAGLQDRIEARLARADSVGLSDLDGTIDFALAFAVIHELPDAGRFLKEMSRALGPDRILLIAEPKGHVKEGDFAGLINTAKSAGFQAMTGPEVRSSWTSVLRRC